MIVYLTRVEEFNASHKLWVEAWSPEQNKQEFGVCANPNFHGHNYKLHVTIKGTPNPTTGLIMDARVLSQIVKKQVTDILDHSNLNLDDNFIPKHVQKTSENLVYYIWQQLQNHLPHTATLHSIKLFETDRIYAEYLGE
jgi:6-pyruvoyltetrahydropterin/6-carboxytetrahydropterin synthase